jgi:hypothetical protein
MTDLNGTGLSNIAVPADGETRITERHNTRGNKKKLIVKYSNNNILCTLDPPAHQNISYEVIDMCGRIVTESRISLAGKDSFLIACNTMVNRNSMYIVRVKTDSGILTQTFFVSR